VTPGNSNLNYDYTHWKKHPKEGYMGPGCCNPTTYRSLGNTWGGQPRYTSG
jgi:hypothetical protein